MNIRGLMNDTDRQKIEQAVSTILTAVGEDPKREGLLDTPKRVARMYEELFSGLDEDPAVHLEVGFTEQYDEMVVCCGTSPFTPCANITCCLSWAMLMLRISPNGKVVGVSKLARVVEAFARRPQVQERLTCQIAELLMEKLGAQGVGVIIEATHTCMTIRGVKKPGSVMVTSSMLGLFRKNIATRNEAMQLLTGGRK